VDQKAVLKIAYSNKNIFGEWEAECRDELYWRGM
jgi:hypothetical protein